MKPPYEQQPGESDKAFAAFKAYRDTGPERSIRKVGRTLGKTRQQLDKWSHKFQWALRLKAWADHIARQEQSAIDDAARRNAVNWAKREQQQREQNWALSQNLLKRANAMLEFPLATTKSKDGKTIVQPTAWNMGQAARLAEVGAKLAALAAGAPTDRTEITGKDGAPIAPVGAGQVVIYLPEKKPLTEDEEG